MWLLVLQKRYSLFTEIVKLNSQNLQSKDRDKTKTIVESWHSVWQHERVVSGNTLFLPSVSEHQRKSNVKKK